MSIYQRVLTWINNRFVLPQERYYPPIKYYRYTFNLVGLNKQVTVIDKNRDDACRKAYDLLRESEVEQLEWAELIKREEVTK